MTPLGRTTVAVVIAAVGAVIAGNALGVNPARHSTPRATPVRQSTAEVKSSYLSEAEAVCAQWLSKAGQAPKDTAGNVAWTEQMAKMRPDMLREWAQVPIPDPFEDQVRRILDAYNASAAALTTVATTYRAIYQSHGRVDYTQRYQDVKAEYDHLNATATQLAVAFGFNQCANEWVTTG